MPFMAWLKGLFGGTRPEEEKRVRIRKREEQPPSSGDMRGSYGFGRRAHRPDPQAEYGFDSDANHWAHQPRS